jgi:hypothetical protein
MAFLFGATVVVVVAAVLLSLLAGWLMEKFMRGGQ